MRRMGGRWCVCWESCCRVSSCRDAGFFCAVCVCVCVCVCACVSIEISGLYKGEAYNCDEDLSAGQYRLAAFSFCRLLSERSPKSPYNPPPSTYTEKKTSATRLLSGARELC